MLAGFPRRSVDGAYSDGPLSSEQILHPEKYWDPAQRDDPTLVRPGRAGRALGRGFKRLAHGVLGELMLGCMVDAPTPSGPAAVTVTDGAAWTNAAAEGWDGDRWELWGRGDTEIVLLTTVWDSAEDAEEFRVALEGRDGFRVRSRDNRVAVVAGAADARAERALERMLPAPRH